MLLHVNATLRLLNPEIEVDYIRPKRAPQRIKLFRQGELGRLIIAVGGHGESVRGTLSPRVRGNLAYLGSQGKVVKDVGGDVAVWRQA